MDNPQDLTVIIRNIRSDDYPEIREAMLNAYRGLDNPVWSRKQVMKLLKVFPEGQVCVEVNGKVAGCVLSLVVDYDAFTDNHTYEQITGKYTFDTHDPDGDVIYGIDVFVHPEYRGLRLGRRLYDARKELCENLNKRAIVSGGRIPGYTEHAAEMSPRVYIEQVRYKKIFDPILSFQLSNDFVVKRVLRNYLPGDKESHAFATLLEWPNIYYEEKPKLINALPSVVRLGLVQWGMRPMADIDALVNQMEFFVDAVSDYKADFILFPEFFNGPLMARFNDQGPAEAIRSLAKHTEPLHQKMRELAVSYNVNIIGGSMPLLKRGHLYNVGYICHRNGHSEEYSKIHITPAEFSEWGMKGGKEVKIFDTDCGRVGVLICYDVEFPELGRLLADQGLDILFVPFQTDTQTGYNRVRLCAQARAIENECYVAISGSVGNLPRVNNMDIQYSQAAVFSPSDFAFPHPVVAEATPNTEMTLFADVNLDLLRELNTGGSVRNLRDRRTDLYEVRRKGRRKS